MTIRGVLFTLFGPEKFDSLEPDQVEALIMISHKLARIVNGDPHYDDSWRDVAGYAQLVANRLTKDAAAKPTEPEKEEPRVSVRTATVDIDIEVMDEAPDELKNILKRFFTSQ